MLPLVVFVVTMCVAFSRALVVLLMGLLVPELPPTPLGGEEAQVGIFGCCIEGCSGCVEHCLICSTCA